MYGKMLSLIAHPHEVRSVWHVGFDGKIITIIMWTRSEKKSKPIEQPWNNPIQYINNIFIEIVALERESN